MAWKHCMELVGLERNSAKDFGHFSGVVCHVGGATRTIL